MGRINPDQGFEKILGEPIGFATNDAAEKLKRNLMLFSCLVILLVVGGVSPSQSVTFAGVVFTDFTGEKIILGAMLILIYTGVHYFSVCVDIFNEWSIRSASAKFVFGKVADDPAYDPLNPRQSTLYSWWLREAARLPEFHEQRLKIECEAKDVVSELKGKTENEVHERRDKIISIQEILNRLSILNSTFESTKRVLTDPVLERSLRRFDNRYRGLINSQSRRVLFFEIVVPLFLGITALTCGAAALYRMSNS